MLEQYATYKRLTPYARYSHSHASALLSAISSAKVSQAGQLMPSYDILLKPRITPPSCGDE